MNRKSDPPLKKFMSDPDVGLMLEFKDGNYDAFGRLVDKYTEPLVNYFFFQSGDRDQAEDCTQDLWSKIFRSRAEYTPRATFSTFIYRVARNLWIDVYRSGARKPTVTTLSGDLDDGGDGPALSERLEDVRDQDPGQALAREETIQLLADALRHLPPEMRDVYVLGEIERLPYAEISEVLRIPVGTVKSRMFNAVRKLKEVLERRI